MLRDPLEHDTVASLLQLDALIHCGFENIPSYMEYITKKQFLLAANELLHKKCTEEKRCDADIASHVCQSADLHVIKVINRSNEMVSLSSYNKLSSELISKTLFIVRESLVESVEVLEVINFVRLEIST